MKHHDLQVEYDPSEGGQPHDQGGCDLSGKTATAQETVVK
jgi:hypothetical protein